jgi:hypothetical protein|eukprot:scaffold615_cov309-Alexandrium_tamarense.AAC.5
MPDVLGEVAPLADFAHRESGVAPFHMPGDAPLPHADFVPFQLSKADVASLLTTLRNTVPSTTPLNVLVRFPDTQRDIIFIIQDILGWGLRNNDSRESFALDTLGSEGSPPSRRRTSSTKPPQLSTQDNTA